MCDCVFGLHGKAFDDEKVFLTPADGLFQVPWKLKQLGVVLDICPYMYKLLSVPTSPPAANKWFIDLMQQAIETREKIGVKRHDYLNFILEMQMKKELSLEEMAGYAFTFFFDGYETSNNFLSAGLRLLAENVGCQEKLRNEISGCEPIDYDRLNHMPYLDNVLNGNPPVFTFLPLCSFQIFLLR